jgi:hypothetical protein
LQGSGLTNVDLTWRLPGAVTTITAAQRAFIQEVAGVRVPLSSTVNGRVTGRTTVVIAALA